ncbi:hypothetical protein Moror_10358 [Moniliophthora roreri MCA 2997]|uniref:DUF6534 domain-containing protein n=1 Tax=Moniliophthora roreri (strain MCA 2997) TaxID=1381753 RepID=V2XE43_MONRO|nr:hypothetical protein Moror_10358 [Moniliophthora roreri MCA 2997]
MLIGGFLAILLFGVSVTQTYIYWNAYKDKDRWIIKYFVLLLFVADVLHCVFIVVYLYDAVIKHFGDVASVATMNWLFNTEPAFSGMIGGMVQAFFGWRVKVLTGSWILFIIIQLCSAIVFLMGIAAAIACGIVKSFDSLHKFQVVVIIWLVCATLADVIITTTLVTYLRKHKTGFKHTDSHLDRIIRLTIQTGLITALWALADLLSYLLSNTGMHLTFNYVLPKLYINSLLSSLNSRGGWKFDESASTSTKHSQNDINLRCNIVRLSTSRPEVFIHVESQETVDHSGKGDQTIVADESRISSFA